MVIEPGSAKSMTISFDPAVGDVVPVRAEHAQRRLAEAERHDLARGAHGLAGTQVERHAVPAPVLHLGPHRRHGLGVRVGRHARLRPVPLGTGRGRRAWCRSASAPRIPSPSRPAGAWPTATPAAPWPRTPAPGTGGSRSCPGRRRSRRRTRPAPRSTASPARRSARTGCDHGSRSARTARSRTGTRGCCRPTPCPGSGRCGRPATRRRPRAPPGSARAPRPGRCRTASR